MPKPNINIGVKWINLDDHINIYCGRGSALGNPFPITNNHSRDYVCDRYAEYFKREANTKDSAVRNEMWRIFKLYVAGNNINLQCFCAGKRCHCETIKESLSNAYDHAINNS